MQIDKAKFDMEMERRKLNRSTWQLVVGAVAGAGIMGAFVGLLTLALKH